MNCKKTMEKYLGYERSIGVPISIWLHLFFCSKCREEVAALQQEFINLYETSPYEAAPYLINDIMFQIDKKNIHIENRISNFKWISAGSILFSSMMLVTFSDTLQWLKRYFGAQIEVPISIMLGSAITAYAVLFVGTHLDGIKEQMDIILKKIQ